MWRSKAARVFLLQSSSFSVRRFPRPLLSQCPSKTLTQIPPPTPFPSKWIFPTRSLHQNPRFFSSGSDTESREKIGKVSTFDFVESGESAVDQNSVFGDESDAIPLDSNPGLVSGESESSSLDFGVVKENGEVEGESSLSSLWEESVRGDDSADIFTPDDTLGGAEDGVAEIDIEQVEKVQSLLQSTSQEQLKSGLNKMDLSLSEGFVARVLQTPLVSAENLFGFFSWASRNDKSVKSSRNLELLVRGVSSCADLSKMEAYMLWDLVKEIGCEMGLLNTQTLNQLIAIFWKLGKARAGLEVFDKFDEFGCNPDANTYYFTIEALGRRSMFDTAWPVCQRMLNSGSLPDGEKVGKIITFFCRGKKAKEAHSVYLKAKENKIYPPRSCLEVLVGGLSSNDETIFIALELLEEYSGESLKYANRPFASVVQGLCRTKNLHEAKKLLMRMVNSGPAPGNAVFNYVITALSKGGEMEDAIALTKVMERRGLRPDVYTYSVIMSGFAKGGLMDEAYKIFCEAKKRHPKLSPVTYHILIRGYCQMEEFEKALECMKEMKEDGLQPNTDEYNKMIQSLCLKALDWRTAEKLLAEMKESGLHLKGITRGLIAAIKELEEEEIQSKGRSLQA
ncbi:pentatricopeptide repeat-containing protein At3g02650, mitochondrial [Phoenix dactylifera]|uniref:Pentatricopeptide repeat-containing protein At3g02650, mitochondrial n=1 Tax=Phoenix dactylifera TaxID=42345 RepID=A0A8B8JC66_PHODC|nr:pentatricopeptide repeat-containing protein At3g02650, mitochondrial [Phoenix dactylifera]